MASVLNADFASLVGMSASAVPIGDLPPPLPPPSATPASGSTGSEPRRNSNNTVPAPAREMTVAETQETIERALNAKEAMVSSALERKKQRAILESKRLLHLDRRIKQLDQEEQRRIDHLRMAVEQ